MIDAKIFCGLPIQFADICSIYPPTVGDVLVNDKGMYGYRLLTKSQDDIEELTKKVKDKKIPTPFEFILINSYLSENFKSCIEEAFKLLTHSDIVFLFETKQIIVGELTAITTSTNVSQLKFITEDNFFDF